MKSKTTKTKLTQSTIQNHFSVKVNIDIIKLNKNFKL